MQLRRLTLRNIRSYEAADLQLGAGTTLLVGDVGAGKTSLLYALEMALFGVAEVEPVHLVRHRARQAEVSLELADDLHRYQLRRRFARRTRGGREVFEGEEGSFAEDGHLRRYTPTELRQRVIDLLGFPDNPHARAHSDLWRWAVYIPQERMRDVLAQRPIERRETVRKALGLEQYKTASDNGALLGRAFGARADALDGRAEMLARFEEELGRWAAAADRLALELGTAREQEATARTGLASAASAAEAADRRAREAAVDRSRAQALREELAQLELRSRQTEGGRAELDARLAEHRAALAAATAELLERGAREAERAGLRERAERLAALAADRDAQVTARDGARRAVVAAAEAAARSESERSHAVAERELRLDRDRSAREAEPRSAPLEPSVPAAVELADRTATARRRLEEDQRRLARHERDLADLESLLSSGECPRCHQPVRAEEFGPHRDEAATALRAVEAEVADRRRELSDLESGAREQERFERATLAWERAEERRRDARRELAAADERRDRAEEMARAARSALADAETALARLPSEAGLPANPAGELAAARAALAEADRRLAELTRVEERHRALGLRIRELEGERATREAEARAAVEAVLRARERLAEVDRRLEGPDVEAELLTLRIARAAAEERVAAVGRLIARTETELTAARERLAEAHREVERRATLRRSAAEARELATFLSGPFRDALTGLEERLLSRAQRDFERGFAKAFRTLVEDPTLAARIDAAFSPTVEIDGEWTPPEALSGGERTALALAYRIALGQVVRGAGRLRLATLILDEPTDGFSPEQVVRVGQLLEELGIPQVLLVSHETGLAAAADRVVRVVKDRGLSRLEPGDPEDRPATEGAEPPGLEGLPPRLPAA